MRCVTVLAAVLASASLVAFAAPQSGNDLFQQALSKERAEGRFEEAIQIYERILNDFAPDRPGRQDPRLE